MILNDSNNYAMTVCSVFICYHTCLDKCLIVCQLVIINEAKPIAIIKTHPSVSFYKHDYLPGNLPFVDNIDFPVFLR